ncbi:protein BatA [Geothrix limicola]|uniref:Protein BatA n=1 Tax=Geothrix limicola TaxID=2927978 RepID=A0ABQ5QGQ4_9BACT|nr:VWA domain-containing protein [Geothrix limicola]GLH74032.1 protein BatA [Geothrix limicola]
MIALRYPLLLLLTVPLVVWAWRVIYRWGIPSSRPSSALARLSSHWIPVLLALALGFAAAGPEWRRPLRGTAPVVDFAVVLDGSSSMRILDRPDEDRWHAARRTLAQFVLRRPDDRFALILFSAHPVTLSPLTADHTRLLRMLARLDIDSRDDGTAIGSALMTAVRRLEDSPARSRVILLITDGVQNRGRVTPMEAAEEAHQNGIRIHAVAIGTNGESLVPLEGGGFAKLRVEVDHATLQQVAHLTGGESFSAEDPAGLERSLSSVDQLEKTLLPVDPPSEGRPLARWFLLAAALLALPLAVDLAFKRGKARPAWLAAS